LRKDFEREANFKNARSIYINYYDNSVYVDGDVRNFSASSNFYLKVASRFSIFFSSLEIETMRYPRFILCDNMEDKGIELVRVHNFQKILIEYLRDFSEDSYQMIYTTSFIPEELNNEKYCVGEFYTEENPSLKNV
jgi:hypothetical protein